MQNFKEGSAGTCDDREALIFKCLPGAAWHWSIDLRDDGCLNAYTARRHARTPPNPREHHPHRALALHAVWVARLRGLRTAGMLSCDACSELGWEDSVAQPGSGYTTFAHAVPIQQLDIPAAVVYVVADHDSCLARRCIAALGSHASAPACTTSAMQCFNSSLPTLSANLALSMKANRPDPQAQFL